MAPGTEPCVVYANGKFTQKWRRVKKIIIYFFKTGAFCRVVLRPRESPPDARLTPADQTAGHLRVRLGSGQWGASCPGWSAWARSCRFPRPRYGRRCASSKPRACSRIARIARIGVDLGSGAAFNIFSTSWLPPNARISPKKNYARNRVIVEILLTPLSQALVPAGPEGGEMGALLRRLAGLGRGCVKNDEKRQSCRVGKGGLSCYRNECHGINNRASEDPRPARVDRAGGGIGEKIRHPMFLVQAPGSAGEVFG